MNQLIQEYKEQVQDWLANLHFSRAHKLALLSIGLVVLVASVGIVFRGHSQPVEIALPVPSIVVPLLVTVDVAGGVNAPGVYKLPISSRVIDAITAAGGVKKGGDVSDVNLARIIKDGEQIYVQPLIPIASAHFAVKRSGPININRATISDFDSLPGVGPVIAARIFSYRKANGPFMSVEDLQKVSGIGIAKFAQLKNRVSV